MALDPQFATAPKIGTATVSTANANRDGTGTLATILTAGASGTRLRALHLRATGITTAGMVRLFIHDGANARLLREIQVVAITPSASVEGFSAHMTEYTHPDLFPLVLPSGWSLRASTHNAESFQLTVEGADL